jgi:hypothetical protein
MTGALDDLRYHWGGAYLIVHPAPGIWLAARHDDHSTIRADNPETLRDKIRSDFLRAPVSRSITRPALRGGALSPRPHPPGPPPPVA